MDSALEKYEDVYKLEAVGEILFVDIFLRKKANIFFKVKLTVSWLVSMTKTVMPRQTLVT